MILYAVVVVKREKERKMPNNVRYSYSALSEYFRGVVSEDKISHVAVEKEPRYSAEVVRYMQTVSKARVAIRNSNLVFKGAIA